MLSKKSRYEKDIHLRYLHKLAINVMMVADRYNYEDEKWQWMHKHLEPIQAVCPICIYENETRKKPGPPGKIHV